MPVVLWLLLTGWLMSGCSAQHALVEMRAGQSGREIARNAEFVIKRVGESDTPRSLAQHYLGDESLYWVVEDANPQRPIEPGSEILIPLGLDNKAGVYFGGYQTVPILCYHKFGNKNGRLTISPKQFRRQMSFLREHGYRVITLTELLGFIKGERAIPRRSVVLTIDDGHRSIYKIAFPILREFNYPATIFMYSDYVNGGGLSWRQLDEMVASGLISVQPHSKTHDNLALKREDESDQSYLDRVQREVRVPSDRFTKLPGNQVNAFAYPFGDSNDELVSIVRSQGLSLGLTVHGGGNAAFANPYLLRRTMIFGDRDLDAFNSALAVFKPK